MENTEQLIHIKMKAGDVFDGQQGKWTLNGKVLDNCVLHFEKFQHYEMIFHNGKKHCEYGPAATFPDNVFWFLNDSEYTFNQWCKELNKTEDEIVYYALKYLK